MLHFRTTNDTGAKCSTDFTGSALYVLTESTFLYLHGWLSFFFNTLSYDLNSDSAIKQRHHWKTPECIPRSERDIPVERFVEVNVAALDAPV
jgi:hypothetical protein